MKPISINLDELDSTIDDKILEQAFGEKSLGLIIINQMPKDYLSLRDKVLKSSSILANLSDDILKLLEIKESIYLVGWSLGKEKLENGNFDLLKGSFYINCSFFKDSKLEGPNLSDIESFSEFKSYTIKNQWFDSIKNKEQIKQLEELKDFQKDCKALINYILQIGLKLSEKLDSYIWSHVNKEDYYSKGYLPYIVKNSTTTKARLLHYFPLKSIKQNDFDDNLWCGEHVDHSCLTALTSAMFVDESEAISNGLENDKDFSGLYIQISTNKEKLRIDIPRDSLVFQIGSSLQEISCNKFNAVRHCVRTSKSMKNLNIARNTLAIFMQPNLDDKINKSENFAQYSLRILKENH
ncbi:Clavaminate synthase-like protein [Ascoidea rubescens DSM 1968]|uniref:Clavaminate synthase-like protein n=1 Tax=Ascoidea rubescens DSM 1968 TaxID=1344418 RepID=A0A1D2V8N2_9ASCO|nr:Clavaminate synthase-like protein [Ascoidea rubescens DSM 1968]ODV58036.1 Clavaminate synthase-like protein [Ascoidea rubescens DSM 1968]